MDFLYKIQIDIYAANLFMNYFNQSSSQKDVDLHYVTNNTTVS